MPAMVEAPARDGDLARGGDILRFEGGPILTLDPARPVVDALAVRGGTVVALGTRAEVRRAVGAGPACDLGGHCLVPAFVDHHVHLLNIGFALANQRRGGALFLDLPGNWTEAQIAERVAARAEELGPTGWVLGAGWSQNGWAMPAMPTHHALTRAAPAHPTLLARLDVHSAWVNEAALQVARIGPGAPDPPGGRIDRLDDGAPAGVLVDRACEPVLARSPRPDDALVREAFRSAADGLASRGYVRAYEAGFLEFPGLLSLEADQERYLGLLLEEDAREPLPLHVHLMVMAPSPLAEKILKDPEPYRRLSPRIGVTHLKMHADGALGSRGALLSHPYHDDPCGATGVCRTSPEELRHWTGRALDAGLDVAVHAIGDRANSMVLDAYEEALRVRPGLDPRRLRVEHFTYVSRSDMERAARMGVILAVQPAFVEPDEYGHVMEELRLGPEQAARAYAFRDLVALGARLAGSTDDYTFVPNAMRTLHAAATRRTPLPGMTARWQPEQCLSREQGFGLLTRWWRHGGREPTSGTLREGGPAHLVVLSGNPFEVPDEEILSLQVCATWKDGRRTFDDGSVLEPRRRRVRRPRPRPRRVPLPKK
ncbi:MAG: amidohydrolase [Myxococcota bacterium]